MAVENRRRVLHLLGASAVLASLPYRLQAKEQAFSKCDKVVDDYIRDYRFQGVVSLGQKGQSLFSRTVGFANFERQTHMTLDTVFGIASISKMLTTVTVLKLIERKQLGLDEPISAYLPDFRKDLGKVLTLRRLLANDSGVLNQFSAAWKVDPTVMEKPMTTMEAVHRYCEVDLIFAPGARFDYSLSNWILVLAIVEAVTHMPFNRAMRSITLDPLKLSQTDSDPSAVDPIRLAAPYTNATPPQRRPAPRQPFVAAAGGYYSDAGDLMRSGHLIFDTNFLTPGSLRSLLTKEFPADPYAMGGSVRPIPIAGKTVTAAWDTGNTSGYRSVLGHRLDGKGTVVVLNNTSMSQKTLDEFSDALLLAFSASV